MGSDTQISTAKRGTIINMITRSFQSILLFILAAGLMSGSSFLANPRAHASSLALAPAPIFTQPTDPAGKLIQSSRRDPDGSNIDKYVWDNFTLQSSGTITEINWVGGYDPTRFPGGGLVIDFHVSIYPSIPAGTEPAVAYPPLVKYQTGGNAGETTIGNVGSISMHTYAFTLPKPFVALRGVKYWVQIEALQNGSIPDWGFSSGTGGDSNHYEKGSGAGGDNRYYFAPGDVAFTLITDTSIAATDFFLPLISR
jgi:hypothetical protein